MQLTHYLVNHWGRIAQVTALGLVLFAVTLLAACTDEETPQATERPQPTATTAAEATSVQPTEAPVPSTPTTSMADAPTAAPTSTPASMEPATPSMPALQVVTTSNIVADWAEVVGGERVEVFSLHSPGADPHNITPGARDIARVADADVVFSVGLGLEAVWLGDLVHNASADETKVVALGEGVDPLEFSGEDDHDDHGDHDDHDDDDDHDDHADDDDHDDHAEETLGRLLVGDGETGKLSIIDLESGAVEQDRFDLGSRAGRIYATESGRFAVAVSSDANAVHVIDGGIYLEAHGDHFDLVEDDVRQLAIDLSGDRPSHLYIGGGWASIFYDNSGEIVLLNEHELEEEGDSYVPVRLNAGPHHGGVVPLEHDVFAVTIQHPDFAQDPGEYRLPIGAEIWDLEGNVLHRAEGCPDLHGDAGNGHAVVFGCTGGVLVIESHDDHFDSSFISAPAGSPEDFRITSVWGYPGLHHFFALGSAVGLYVVEPEDGIMEQLIASTEGLRPIQVHVGHGGESLLVVMNNGELRLYDAHDGELLAYNSEFLTRPVETGFWARPHIATAPGAIFVTDSVGGEVFQLDAHDLEVVEHWHVEGTPTKIAFVGIVGEPHGHDDHGDHDAHDDHDDHMTMADGHDDHGHEGHHHGPLDPHFWFDPNRVKIAVNDMAARLAELDPEGADYYAQNAADYGAQLDELHSWIQEQVAVVPQDRRLLITSHDTFAYFADIYGFEVIGTFIPSLAPDVEPSAEHIAGLVEVIREHNAPAVFSETTVSGKLPEAVARETGAVLAQLYADSLGEKDSPAGTYLGMVRTNVERIVEALT